MTGQEAEASGLSRDAVIQAALDLLDTDGVEGLSMRAVAERLGVRAASLYWHLRDKEQLLESVAAAVLDRVEVAISASGWRSPVAAACDELAEFLTTHRGAADVVIGCLPAVQRSRLVHDIARTLGAAGLVEAEAAAFALVVETTASVLVTADATVQPPRGSPMTLAIDSGSWRVAVGAAPAGTVDAARSVGGGGAPSVELRPRRGGNRGGVELSRQHAWNIKVHGGTWNTVLDLSGLRVTGIELDSGAGNVSCILPAPVGVVPIRVNSGIVGVTLRRPRDTAVHAIVSSGSAKVRLDDRPIRAVTADVQWETPGALLAADRYDLTVYSGCVRVTLDASAPGGARPARPSPAADRADASGAPAQQGVGLILDGIERRLTRR
jgi:TetR/AcrR family transcriptional regulator, tetracycline repressor protein